MLTGCMCTEVGEAQGPWGLVVPHSHAAEQLLQWTRCLDVVNGGVRNGDDKMIDVGNVK